MDNVSVRALEHAHWQDLFKIRLEAVTKHPNYFLSSPEKTKELTEEDWKRRIKSDKSRVFGLFDGDKLVGITGIFISEEEPNAACLVMSYIKEDYRGRGYSKLFYEARINWAIEQNALEVIKVCHRDGNEPSKAAILKHGFKFTGTGDIDWPDGTRDTEYQYELDLAILRNPHRVV